MDRQVRRGLMFNGQMEFAAADSSSPSPKTINDATNEVQDAAVVEPFWFPCNLRCRLDQLRFGEILRVQQRQIRSKLTSLQQQAAATIKFEQRIALIPLTRLG